MLTNFLKYVMHTILVKVDKINIYDIDDISEIDQTRRRFDSGRLHQEPMSSILDKEFSILERKPVSYRMRARDEAGKHYKKTEKKKTKEHFREDWDADLWD